MAHNIFGLTAAMIKLLLTGLLAFAAPQLAAAPIESFQQAGVSYDPQIPTPDEAFGFGLGEKPVRHDQMVAYLTDLARQSDRIDMEVIGHSHEGRPILFFTVSAPDNLQNKERLRQDHLARLRGAADAPADGPAVLWLNYGVHGAESSGMDAAIPTLYHLAAAQGDAIENTLDQAIILITAVFNPDGHSRRIDHVYTYLAEVPVADPAHEQHNLWITARTNHYWFDLNRQWLLQTQPESRAWMAQWHKWKPQVTNDFHEMGSNATYYFHPGVPARKNPLIPDRARRLAQDIADFHAKALDAQQRLYYSEEGFDNFYVGKGSTYPQVNGSVGFLYEAGAARGGVIDTPNGQKRYDENIHTHYTTSLSSIEGALAVKADLAQFQQDFFAEAHALAEQDATKAYVYAAPGDAARSYHFTDLMQRHDIQVHRLAQDITVDGVQYRAGEAFVVPLKQAQYRMIRAAFDHVTEFEEEIFYDVSGWTLPASYDLHYAALGQERFSEALLGDPVADPRFPEGRFAGASDYGYLFQWAPYYAPRALYRLLDEGVIVRAAFQEGEVATTDGVKPFTRGSLFVPLAGQTVAPDRIAELLRQAAAQDGLEIFSITSGQTPTPGVDLGASRAFKPVPTPKVLLLIGEGIASYDAGEVWHLLDHRMHMPVVMVPTERLSDINLWDYSHIVLSGGRTRFAESQTKTIARWVRDGGTLVGVRQGALWAERHLLDRRAPDPDEPERPDGRNRFDYAELPEQNAKQVIGGAIFRSDLDITHPLGFGYGDRDLPSHKNMATPLQYPASPVAQVARYRDAPLVSGYASEERQASLAGTPMAVHEPMGAGAVVLFADNPNFRGTFLGTSKLFLNSLFFSTLIDRARVGEDQAAGADVH